MLTEKLPVDNQAIDSSFLAKILTPYKPTGTDYLKVSRAVENDTPHCANDAPQPIFTMNGDFSIQNSCYIQDTGHFNAVEFLICFNQLAYSAFGYLINNRFFDTNKPVDIKPECLKAMASISIDKFFDKQLSSMLILKASTSFRRIINARKFFGRLSINKCYCRKGTIFVETSCVFTDAGSGYADGEVLLAYPIDAQR